MSIDTLVITMNLDKCEQLIDKMNLKGSVIVGNQTNFDSTEKLNFTNSTCLVINRNEKGVGNNRNTVLFASKANYCVLADDDMLFYDNYLDVVESFFKKIKDADLLIFNIDSSNNLFKKNHKIVKINNHNYMNYGAARFAFKRYSILYNSISFNLMFGGGATHSCGEDSIFLKDCLDKRLKIYAVPVSIAKLLDDRESTWFTGYSRKYFYDKGVFLAITHRRIALFLGLLLLIKHRKEYSKSSIRFKDMMEEVRNGINYVKRREFNKEENFLL